MKKRVRIEIREPARKHGYLDLVDVLICGMNWIVLEERQKREEVKAEWIVLFA